MLAGAPDAVLEMVELRGQDMMRRPDTTQHQPQADNRTLTSPLAEK